MLKAFKCVDRIFVHTISDLNRLKNINLIDNVTLFPHGILEYKNINNYVENNTFFDILPRRKIASYGFLLPHKGIIQLLEAIDILRNQNFIVRLNLITSIYNENDLSFVKQVTNYISSLKLKNLVNLNTDYLSDEQSLNELSKNDLILFPYQDTQESSSASVRHGLATGKPVMVTPLDIFNDVSNAVSFCSGTSSIAIANSICEWYKSKDKAGEEFNRKKRIELIEERSFSKLGKRFSSIIKGLYINKSS